MSLFTTIRSRLAVTAVIAGISVLSGCAANTPPPPTADYFWGSYIEQVYAHFQSSSSAEEQAATLEQRLQQAKLKPAPGYYAHLGMLYVMLGQTDNAMQAFKSEQQAFPESAHYMRFLMNSLEAPHAPAASLTPHTGKD